MKLHTMNLAETRTERNVLVVDLEAGTGKLAVGTKRSKIKIRWRSSLGFEGGQTPLYRRLPKRGFTNIHAKTYTEVTFKMLNKSKATDVTAETLLEEGIIGKINDGIVILATGKLDKKLNVKAKEEIEALGGKVEVI